MSYSVYFIEPDSLPNKAGEAVRINQRWTGAATPEEAQNCALENHNMYARGGSAYMEGDDTEPYSSWDAMVADYLSWGVVLFVAKDNPKGGLVDQSEL